MVLKFDKIESPKLSAYGSDYPKYLAHYQLYVDAVTKKKNEFKKSVLAVRTPSKKPDVPPVPPDQLAKRERLRGRRRAQRERRSLRELETLAKKSAFIAEISRNNVAIAKGPAPSDQKAAWTLVTRRKKPVATPSKAVAASDSIKILSISDERDDRARVKNVDDPWIQWNKRKRLFLAGKEAPDGTFVDRGAATAWSKWARDNPEPERFMVWDTVGGCLVPFINGLDDV